MNLICKKIIVQKGEYDLKFKIQNLYKDIERLDDRKPKLKIHRNTETVLYFTTVRYIIAQYRVE